MFLNLHDKDLNNVSVRKVVQNRKQTVVEKSLPLKLAEKKIERINESIKKPQSGASTTITTQLQYKDRPRQLHNFDWNTSEINSANTATPNQFPTTSAEIITKIYLAKFREKDSLQSRKPSRAFENQKRREKTPIDVTQKWDNVFAPNQALSLNDVRKLFITCGLDYEDVIPLNIRQKIVRDTQGGKKMELKALKEMVSEFLQSKSSSRGRKALSMKKLRQPQIDLSLPEGTRIATVGLAEASEASEIHSIIEKKGFFHKNMNMNTTDHERVSEHSLSKKKSQKILTADDFNNMQGRQRVVNSRFDFTNYENKRFVDRSDIIKDKVHNVVQQLSGSNELPTTKLTAQQQQLHFQILKCRDIQYEYDIFDRDGKVLNAIVERPPRSRAADKLPRKNQCNITIRIVEERWHQNHPVNQAIRVINQFSIEAFLKSGMSSFFHKKRDSMAKNQPQNRLKGLAIPQTQTSQQAQLLAQNNQQPPLVMSPAAANSANPNAMDMKVICSLAEQLVITIPRNHDLRSKAFICHAKEQMLRKLYDSLNQANGLELNFKRQNFSHYKGFVGRGNNAQLIFQLFKGTRWWWNLYSEAILDENGKPIILPGQTQQLLREDFKEHNFIFTQWKRQYHFQVLKQLKVTSPESEPPTDQEPSKNLKNVKETKHAIYNQGAKETNISNEWRIYAKMEANYHLSNKYALFYNMTKYYRSINQDPWDVLPLTFHIKKGTKDQAFFDFLKVFRQFEEQTEAFKILQKQMIEADNKKPQTEYKTEEIQMPIQSDDVRNLLPVTQNQQSQVTLQEGDPGFKPNNIADLRKMLCNRCKKTDNFIQVKQNLSGEFVGRPQEMKDQSLGRPFHLQTTMSFNNPTDFLESPEYGVLRQRKQSNITSTHGSSFGTKVIKTTPRKKTLTPSKVDFTRQSNSQHQSQTNNYNSNAEKAESDPQSAFKGSLTCACCGDVFFDYRQLKGNEKTKIINRMDPQSEYRITKDDQSLLITTSNTALAPNSIEPEQCSTTRRTLNQIDKSTKKLSTHPYSSHSQQSIAPNQISTRLPVIVGTENESSKDLQDNTVIMRETVMSFRHNHANNMSRDRTNAKSFLKSPINRKKTYPLNAAIKGKAIVRQESQEPKPVKPDQQPDNSRQRSPLTKTGFKEEKKTRSFSPDKNIWIVKPGENTNRGNGIDVCQSLKEIKKIVSQSDCDPNRTFILQKYIERPALYMQRKFDIRCFGMLTLVNQKLKGFTYDDGYLRTSSRIFKRGQLANKLIHLTNDAVQKKSDEYGKFETGNKLTFGEYQAYLSKFQPELKIDFRTHIFSQIKQIMTDTFRATYKIIAPTRDMQHHTFEIFGFDFMLDEDFKVYLIEVNTNPCLETTCPILSKIITDMVDNAFKVAIDPLYPPPNHQKRMNTQISVMQWHLSFDEELDAERIQQMQTRQNSSESTHNGRQAEDDSKEMEAKLISEMEAAPEIFD